ncbi:MAG: cardiolipin synthase [Breznakia sp.]
MKQVLKLFSNRIVIVSFLILLQLLIVISGVYMISTVWINANLLFGVFSILIAIYVINRSDNPSYKISWAVMIIGFPMIGWLLYLMFGAKQVPKSLRQRDHDLEEEMALYIEHNNSVFSNNEEIDLQNFDRNAYKQSNYIWNASNFPPYAKTETVFFKTGEEKFEEMMVQLEKAEHFIFLEYFILAQGYMLDTLVDCLKRKVKQGVDVRFLYDDFGALSKLPPKYNEYLNAQGIKCKVFNPLRARLAVQMNNRDHRKILVVDGRIAMTGGVNIADEYINRIERFGHWKDGGCMIEGEAVWSFTLMFLQFWNFDEKKKDVYHTYQLPKEAFQHIENDGIVQPYSDSPTDDENVGKCAHVNLVNSASRYVYITTPYLVIDSEMKMSLKLAAKNGVDVRILVPHIPDKWYVFQLTRHNYQELTKSGVRIYEYTPGFVHAKNFIADDKYAIVGTTNMDFRSYYLHYECGVWFYKSKLIKDIKKDYLDTLKQSCEVTYEDCMRVKIPVRILRSILNIFAPLM